MTEVATLTLTDFLLARIDEDEADARSDSCGAQIPENCWSTARVLAECEAKRAIVESFGEAVAFANQSNREGPAGEVSGLQTALKFAASVYADHPDYREAWRVGS